MARFFTSPNDVEHWVRESSKNAQDAAGLIIAVLQDDRHHEDIFESTRRIFANENAAHAATTLYNIFAGYDLAEKEIKTAGKNVQAMKKDNMNQGLTKEAQIMRQPGEYPMRLRVCPKLPASVGNRLISTYNCRHYCLDSIVLDDDPDGVYCAEALWRKHVMDKFSREWMDPKTGQYVGGYIHNRFHVFPDAGTPANPDVPRDQGNRMELSPNERSRQPQPHEYSMERRLEEARDKGSTKGISVTAGEDIRKAMYAQAESKGFIKIAAADIKNPPSGRIHNIFNDAIDLHLQGVPQDEALATLAQTHNVKVEAAYQIQAMALRKVATHGTDVYLIKTAQAQAPAIMPVAPMGGQAELYYRVSQPIPNYALQPNQILQKVGEDATAGTNVYKVVMANVAPEQWKTVTIPQAQTTGFVPVDEAEADHPAHGEASQAQAPAVDSALDSMNPDGADQVGESGQTGEAAGKNF